jgi:hypothetical protein
LVRGAGVSVSHKSAILAGVETPEDRPAGAIFIFEGNDLAVQPEVEAAERFIEPFDAAEVDAYDELGRRLQARVIGEGWPKQVKLFVVHAGAQLSALMDRVSAFLEAVGEPTPSAEDPSVWVREAAATLLARQRSDTPWGRLRRRLGRSR